MTKAIMKKIKCQSDKPTAKEEYGKAAEKNEIKDAESKADQVEMPIPSARRTRIFDLLNLVDDLQTNSLDDVLEKAIAEGEKFKAWQNSDRDLENIRLFHKIADEYLPIPIYESFFSGFLGNRVEVEIVENSQFEIWKCEQGERNFPLYRIPFSKVIAEGEFSVNEQLKENYFLKIQAERKENSICFSYTLSHLTQKIQFSERLNCLATHYKEALRNIFNEKFLTAVAQLKRTIRLKFCFSQSAFASDFRMSNVRECDKLYRIGEMFKPVAMGFF
ncbi:MAG TPA: hypothetical protein PKE69_03220 [Pyrinomonadaceae bacterium]|nr:hypothetical protein [Pyrinomonadaceae bacterium]